MLFILCCSDLPSKWAHCSEQPLEALVAEIPANQLQPVLSVWKREWAERHDHQMQQCWGKQSMSIVDTDNLWHAIHATKFIFVLHWQTYICLKVNIYVDAVINHMCGAGGGEGTHSSCGSWFNAGKKDFPSVPYSNMDFNDHKCRTGSGNIENYGDANQVNHSGATAKSMILSHTKIHILPSLGAWLSSSRSLGSCPGERLREREGGRLHEQAHQHGCGRIQSGCLQAHVARWPVCSLRSTEQPQHQVVPRRLTTIYLPGGQLYIFSSQRKTPNKVKGENKTKKTKKERKSPSTKTERERKKKQMTAINRHYIKLCKYNTFICKFLFRLLIWEVNRFPLQSTSIWAGWLSLSMVPNWEMSSENGIMRSWCSPSMSEAMFFITVWLYNNNNNNNPCGSSVIWFPFAACVQELGRGLGFHAEWQCSCLRW